MNGTTDVSSNYTITKANGTLTVSAKAITIKASNQSKTYDGTALSANTTCEVTSGSVVSGHTLSCTSSGSQTAAGSSTKTLSTAKVMSGTTDVSSNYTITKANGTLTVSTRNVTITAGSTSRAYNANALTNSSCSGNNLVSGHSVSCTMTSASTITTPGSVTNTINTKTIKDSSNNDVTSNYNITTATGTLTVTTASFSGGSVAISGNNIVGSTLTATITAPTPTPDSYTYQWYRGDTAISGANSSTYSLVAADLNNIIKVKVTAKKTYYNDYSPSGFTVATTAASNGTQKTAYKYTATTKKNVSSATGSDTSVSCYAYASTGGCNVTLPANPYTLTGWTFNGWVNAGTGTTTTTTSGTAASGTMNITSNVNIVATWYKSHSATFTLQDSNAATASANSASCTAYNGAASCTISTTPTLTAKTGYTVVGWGTSTSSTSAASSFTSGNTYYSVTYNSTALSGTFTVQDTNAATKSGGSTSCYRYNGSSSCTITAPKLAANTNYSVVGWKKDGTTASTTSDLAATGSATVSITANVTYKSVTSRTLTAYPQKNLSSATGTPSNVTCTAYNGQSCNVTTPAANAYSLSNWSIIGWKKTGDTTTTTSTATSGDAGANASLSISDNTNIVAIWRNSNYNTQYTATYWYNTNTNSGSISLTSTSKSCNIAAVYNGATIPTTCAAEVPSAVRSSTGKYNGSSTYAGLANALSRMNADVGKSSTTVTISANSTFYAIYQQPITIYYQNSSGAIASSSTALYRNEYITNVTSGSQNMNTITSTGTNATQATSVTLSNIRGTFEGINSTANSTTVYPVNTSSYVTSNTTTFYAISNYTTNVTATFYYSKDTSGTVASVQASGTQTRYAYCTSSSAVTTSVKEEGTISPTLSPAEVAPTGTQGIGWAWSSTADTGSTPTTENTKYYRLYLKLVKIYYPRSVSTVSNNSVTRQAYLTTSTPTVGTTKYTTIINKDSRTQLTNSDVTSSVLPNMYGTFTGLATSANTTTKYDINSSTIVNGESSTYYAVNTYTTSVTATFYYSKDTSGTVASVQKAGSQERNVYCSDTTTATNSLISNGSISPSLSPAEVAPTGTVAAGWSIYTESMNTPGINVSPTTANTKYYRVYSQALTIYYPTATSGSNSVTSANNKIYRNAFMTSASATTFTTRIVNGSTGTTQLTNSDVTSSILTNMYGTFEGLDDVANESVFQNIDAKGKVNSSTTTFYAVNTATENVTVSFHYSTSSTSGYYVILEQTGTRPLNLYCKNTSEATTSVNSWGSITPTVSGEVAPYGTTAIGWATSQDTMSTKSPSTQYTDYYRVYRGNVTNYYWNGSSYTTRTLYRNVFLSSGSMSTSVLSTSTTGTSNYTTETGPNGKTWKGLGTTQSGGVQYINVSSAAETSHTTLYTFYRTDAVDVYYDNTNTGMTCETVQCALDNISRMLTRDGASSGGNNYLCKKATALHVAGYGQLPTTFGTAGNAYICDVNGDGTYNATNEMFYYISDYYNTSTQTTNSNYATLIYYNNVSEGSPSNTASDAYDSSNNNWYGPRTAMLQLPETTLWKDAGLYKNARQILGYWNTYKTTTAGGTLPTDFSYKGYSGRLLTTNELKIACPSASPTGNSLANCKYLLENTGYQSSSYKDYWLENPHWNDTSSVWFITGSYAYLNTSIRAHYGTRPAIDVRKCDIEGSGVTICN